jgi:hypothetical protein
MTTTTTTTGENKMTITNLFCVGQTYYATSICDSNCHWTFKIVRRTAKSVWVQGVNDSDSDKVERRSVYVLNGAEHFRPFGSYSFAPQCGADDLLDYCPQPLAGFAD